MVALPKGKSRYEIDSGDEVETSDDESDFDMDEAVNVATDTVTTNGQLSPNPEKILSAILGRTQLHSEDSNDHLSNAEDTLYQLPPPPSEILHEAVALLQLPLICRVCQHNGDPATLLICTGCGRGGIYHTDCWDRWPDHHSAGDTFSWAACEKVKMSHYAWISWLLNSKVPAAKQKSLHRKDLWTTWFGVPYHQDAPLLHTYPRLQNLLQNGDLPDCPTSQLPSLVSFFGDTGGGKSTLIMSLIKNTGEAGREFETPVPGNQADLEKSTSGDVHMYADPLTISAKVPIFYVDCEGRRGSSRSVASQLASPRRTDTSPFKRKTLRIRNPDGAKARPSTKSYEQEVGEHQKTASQRLHMQWAKVVYPPPSAGPYLEPAPPHIHHESTKLVVGELYPRLLYTFSDVVCFITNNVKYDKICILKWASSGHERTVNQRIRPALLIIINKFQQRSDPQWFDVNHATERLLSHLQLSGSFDELRTKWADRGKIIQTAQDLILCYYESFRVIYVPDLTSPQSSGVISQQLQCLYQEIRLASSRLRAERNKVGMDLDTESLNTYIEHAFNRLAKDLKAPIDFYYLSSNDPVIPTRFSEHMTAVIVKMLAKEDYAKTDSIGQEMDLLNRLTPYLASCIAMQITDGSDTEAIDRFIHKVQMSIRKCRERHFRCEAMNASGLRRCLNHWDGHEKGHQFSDLSLTHLPSFETPDMSKTSDEDPHLDNSSPKLSMGIFETSFGSDEMIKTLVAEVDRLIYAGNDAKIHTLSQTARSSGVSTLFSNRTCLTCLVNCPLYVLPCSIQPQHAICEPCAQRSSITSADVDSYLSLEQCPLDCELTKSPWIIRKKPKNAGVRLMALDGGGIRGIIELCILKRVVDAVGHNIPIQELFDLAIGTSTGGIIALGLFKMEWSVEAAILKFKDLSHEAFSSRQLLSVPGFKNVAQVFCSYRYESAGIQRALKSAFGLDPLFGQAEGAKCERVKVGVVAAVRENSRPYLFSNYSRNPTDSDCLVRADDPRKDLLSWEAARSTSAAPMYFKPFFHSKTSKTYVDGAMCRNNPVRIADEERQLIWQNEVRLPDIILSIGTGLQVEIGTGIVKEPGKKTKTERIKKFLPRGIRKNIATIHDVVQSTLSCQKEWEDFLQAHRADASFLRACHRLDVSLTRKLPGIDEVNMIESLEREAKYFLSRNVQQNHYQHAEFTTAAAHVDKVSLRLLAALFYYDPSSPSGTARSLPMKRGHIRCRLSPSMKTQFRSLLNEEPRFRVRDVNGRHDIPDVQFDTETFSSDELEFVTGDTWTIE
ncbi:hypothetical protein FKW77_010061 [Venturia effusa]|uniref:PNPLA domain-containing protein n=1 Tax=Venturia effusa TaxID=50376 RepID=A0A517LA41_9PEZI|nr:hypothetical protein FKW77_010061 [Venturia effusa]